MAALGSLVVKLALEYAQFTGGLDKSEQAALQAAKRVQDTFDGLKGKIAGIAGDVAGGLAAAFTVDAFAKLVRGGIDAADAMDEMSGRIGISAKELSSLQLSYKQAGMGVEDMGSSLAKLSKGMSDNNIGLRALGVNTRNADGSLRTTTGVLLDVADKFQGMQDGAGKTAMAMEIFGKSGAAMVPLLNGGSQGIREMTEMAEKLGLVIEDSTAAQAGQFNDTLELLGLGVSGVGMRIAGDLLPTLNGLAGSFLESMTQGDALTNTADFLASGLKILYTVCVGVVEIFSTVGKVVGGLMAHITNVLGGYADVIGKILNSDWSGAFDAAKNTVQRTGSIITSVGEDISGSWARTAKTVAAAWDTQGNAAVESAAKTLKVNKDLLAAEKLREEAAKAGAAAAKKSAQEQQKLIDSGFDLAKSLLAQDSGLSGDFVKKWDSLGAAYQAGAISLALLTSAQAALLAQQPAMKAAQDAIVKAAQAAADARHKEADGIADWLQAQDQAAHQSLAGVKDRIVSLQDEERALALSQAQHISLAEAVELVAMARLREKQAGFFEGSDGYLKIQEEIDARTQLAGMMGGKAKRDEWTESVQQYDDIFRKGFADMVNGGKGAWKSFTQSLVTTFKTSVADQIYKMFAQPFVMKLVASLISVTGGAASGLASAGQESGGLSSLSGISNLYSAASSIATVGGQVVAGTMSLANALGTIGANATGTGISGLLAANGAYGTAAAGTASAGAGGLMSAMAAIPGWGWAAMGAAAIAAFVLGNKGKPTSSTGESQIYFDAAGAQSGQRDVSQMAYFNAAANANADAVVKGMQASFTQIATSLGATMAASGFSYGGNTGKGGESPNFAIGSFAGSNSFYSGEQKVTDGAVQEAASRAVFAALQGSELPRYLKGAFDGMTAGSMSQDDIGKALTAAQGLKAFHDQLQRLPAAFSSIKDLSFAATQNLIDYSGSLENLTGNLSGFYTNFFSAEEQRAQATKLTSDAFASLGIVMPEVTDSTRAWYRAEVERLMALDQSVPANARATAGALALQGAINDLAPAASAVAAVVDTVAASISDTLRSLQSDATGLQIEIMRKTGNAGGADYAQRALDTAGLSAAELAMYDYNNGLRAQIAALDEAAAAAQAASSAAAALTATNQGWTDQLALLSGAETERSLALRNAGDDSTRALMAQVYAQQDLAAATATAAEAAKTAAASLAQVQAGFMAAAQAGAQQFAATQQAQKADLQGQLDALNLTGAALADKQFKALSGVNAVLFRQVQATTAVADAQKDLIAVSQDAASSFGSLGDSLRDFRAGVLASAAGVNGTQAATTLAASNFRSVSSRAGLGDKDAMGQLAGAGQGYLTAAAASASTALDYERALLTVLSGTDSAISVADRQVSLAEQQLGALVGIKEVLTMAQAQSALASAQGSLDRVNANAPFDLAMAKASDAYRSALNNLALQGFGTWQQAYDDPEYAKTLAIETAAKEAALKAAYEATVVGIKAGRSQMVSAPVPTPSRSPAAGQGGSPDVVAVLNQMRSEQTEMRSEQAVANREIALNTLRFARLADKWDIDGQPAVRQPVAKAA